MAGQGSNMEQFEVYFQRADVDRDGRISGAEAVSFLQGSNLPKQVLAQVWMHADQSHSGFLSRGEFYNALKLVTVAQSKRELTPEIVKAALYGPASAKIPAPQINLAAIPAPQSNSVGAAPAPVPAPQMRPVGPQLGSVTPTVSQHPGFRGQAPQSQQYLPSQGSHLMRPPLAAPSTGVVRPQHGVTGLDFPRGGGAVTSGPPALHGVTGGTTSGPTRPTPNRGITPNTLVASRSLDSLSAIVSPRNENTSDSMFGGEAFSVSQTLPRQGSAPPFSASNAPASTALAPVTSGSQSSAKPDPFEALQSTFTRPSSGSQQQLTQSTSKTSQQHSAQTITPLPSSGIPAVSVNSTAEQPQPSWPKMTRAGVQKYAKVFMEVDTDRDGRITGEQARNLFLSWRLPRGSSEDNKKGAAFLAVCRGKVSEGIDFSDEMARVVIVVGIPFPNINDIQVSLKKKFNDTYKLSKSLLSGSEWYCQQAFRAVNQATGRCIRHKFDYGAIIFLDERFYQLRNRAYISKWLRNSIKQYDCFDDSLDGLQLTYFVFTVIAGT